MNWLKSLLRGRRGMKFALETESSRDAAGNYAPVSRDTQAAIAELSQVAKDNPDAVEIYLALGNLYRSHGEIERAVQIRQNLIVRPGLNEEFKAKAWYELGLDYKRGGFIDRSLGAFEQARRIAGDSPAIVDELARLTADTGDYERASRYYAQLGNEIAEAHYMVRLAREKFADNDVALGTKWLKKALKTYPGSVEAWLEHLVRDLNDADWPTLSKHLNKALSRVDQSLAFVLFEGLLAAARARNGESGELDTDKPFRYHPEEELCNAVLAVLEKREPDLLAQFYAAWMVCSHDREESRKWLEKTLVLNPDFWPARLELLAISMDDQPLSPAFRQQLEFFILRARELKRFVCRRCGLKREQVFFMCPRCHSWHSISYRIVINE
ncbi:lipopolysaccharide biosynthesis regulator YciM [Desulfobaculum xiamenense]|uniref:Lipopolysaccharide biosynthesis regulator YciM n=1 Tax=Desulfobaculum xiamenense TaxID=995050 RepID=A0A846QQ45_9BACT|nr:tetratricopeptide repeat protein [Desulfobaculum xiamenense]NJB66809.1 lipopolysaccharide biosynthesis regulator YciM [Desulfobaculum xiamenense]